MGVPRWVALGWAGEVRGATLLSVSGHWGHPELARPLPQRDSAWRGFAGDNGGGGGS